MKLSKKELVVLKTTLYLLEATRADLSKFLRETRGFISYPSAARPYLKKVSPQTRTNAIASAHFLMQKILDHINHLRKETPA